MNLDNKSSKRTRWVSLFTDKDLAIYFDYFGIEYIKEVLNKIKDKSIIHNIFRMQDNKFIMHDFIVSFLQNICLQENIC